jgi:glycine/D-amino acid oxidase-like deaminating enzyme
VTDTARKVVFARLGERLRVAGMVEIMGYGRDIPPGRIAACASPAQVFPGADFSEVQPWSGMRPATPPACPSPAASAGPRNLWLNTGHGAGLHAGLWHTPAQRGLARLINAAPAVPECALAHAAHEGAHGPAILLSDPVSAPGRRWWRWWR